MAFQLFASIELEPRVSSMGEFVRFSVGCRADGNVSDASSIHRCEWAVINPDPWVYKGHYAIGLLAGLRPKNGGNYNFVSP